jgi:sugar lactone lactonase YvrE
MRELEMSLATVHDDRVCALGEGAFWHPERQQLFWFDVVGKSLLTRTGQGASGNWSWWLGEQVSACGWIDRQTLLIASETSLSRFSLETGARERVCALEADNPLTRCNDGRADPWGGFWISTMGQQAQPDAGAIYRYYRGELRQLVAPVSIPNAICFSPDRRYGYFADMAKQRIWRQPLAESDGWPQGEPELFVDCRRDGVYPDGAVVDRAGRLWNAQWGAGRIACYDRDGSFINSINLPVSQTTCPAFGGRDFRTLFVTSATQDLSEPQLREQRDAGKTFALPIDVQGLPEPQVQL